MYMCFRGLFGENDEEEEENTLSMIVNSVYTRLFISLARPFHKNRTGKEKSKRREIKEEKKKRPNDE